MLRRLFLGLAVIIVLVSVGGAGFALFEASAFNASAEKVYDFAPPDVHAVNDPAVIERGKHLVDSLGGCRECHGADLGGKTGDDVGPIGVLHAPNLTTGKGGIGG